MLKEDGSAKIAMSWFKFHLYEYLSDSKVKTLTIQQKGMLHELWVACYMSDNGMVTSDLDELHLVLGVRTKSEREDLKKVLKKFFIFSEDETGYFSERIMRETEIYKQKVMKLREAAARGGRQKVANAKQKAEQKAEQKLYHSSSDKRQKIKEKEKEKEKENRQTGKQEQYVSTRTSDPVLAVLPACLPVYEFNDLLPEMEILLRAPEEKLDDRVLKGLINFGLGGSFVGTLQDRCIWGNHGLWALLESVRLDSVSARNPAGILRRFIEGKSPCGMTLGRVFQALSWAEWEEKPGDGTDEEAWTRTHKLSAARGIGLDLIPLPGKNKIVYLHNATRNA